MPISKPPKIATLGYYGFGNLGDEAVLAGIRRAIRQEIDSPEMLVLSANAAETSVLHPGVATVDRWNWRAVAGALRGTDVFVFGGGSLLQDATSVQSVVWYTLMALLARRRCRRVLWWGQGIGPLRSQVSRRLVRLIANQADAITVRDNDSAVLLKAIGARGSIHQVADPAFALEPLDLPHSVGSETSRDQRPVVVALRSWKEDALGTALRGRSLKSLFASSEEDVEICGLPMHLPEDAAYLGTLPRDGISVRDWRGEKWTPEHALGFVNDAGLVVAMRLHALIFAARCGVPFVALSYDPKVDALASAAGQSDALATVEGVTVARLTDTIEKVMGSASARRKQLREFAAVQGDRARQPARICRELL